MEVRQVFVQLVLPLANQPAHRLRAKLRRRLARRRGRGRCCSGGDRDGDIVLAAREEHDAAEPEAKRAWSSMVVILSSERSRQMVASRFVIALLLSASM